MQKKNVCALGGEQCKMRKSVKVFSRIRLKTPTEIDILSVQLLCFFVSAKHWTQFLIEISKISN